MENNRTEIINSYFAVRNLLGLTNPGKNQIINLAFEETKAELFIKNGLTNKRLLLLTRLELSGKWVLSTTYGEAEPLAIYLQVKLNTDRSVRPTEACFGAIESLFNYKD